MATLDLPDELVRRLEALSNAEQTPPEDLVIEMLNTALAGRSRDHDEEADTIDGVLERAALSAAQEEMIGFQLVDLDIKDVELPEGVSIANVVAVDSANDGTTEWESIQSYEGAEVGTLRLSANVTFTGTSTFTRKLDLTYNATINPNTLAVADLSFDRAEI